MWVWHPDVLHGGVFVDAFGATFTSEPGLLDAPKRCSGVGDHSGVEADQAEFDLICHAQRPVVVLGEVIGGKSGFGCIRQPDSVSFTGETDDSRYRTKAFLLQNGRAFSHRTTRGFLEE